MLGLTLEVMVHARQFPSSSSRELLIPGAWHPPARASTWWAHPAEQFIRLTSASTAQSILVPDYSNRLTSKTLLKVVVISWMIQIHAGEENRVLFLKNNAINTEVNMLFTVAYLIPVGGQSYLSDTC